MRYSLFLFMVSFLSCIPSYASTISHDNLLEQAYAYAYAEFDFLDERSELSSKGLDPRMPERECISPLQFELANAYQGGRHITIQVSCEETYNPWRLYLAMQIKQLADVVVATRALPLGHILQADDLAIVELDAQQVTGVYYTDLNDLIGAKVKRRLGAQQVVRANQACFVCRGDDVTLVSISGTLRITATGVARQDGMIGDRVQVRNSRSKKDVQGIVTAVHEVTVQ